MLCAITSPIKPSGGKVTMPGKRSGLNGYPRKRQTQREKLISGEEWKALGPIVSHNVRLFHTTCTNIVLQSLAWKAKIRQRTSLGPSEL